MSGATRRCLTICSLVASLLLVSACQKTAPPPEQKVSALEHVAPSPVGTTQTILRKTFNLKTSETFPFEIPAHATRPHLHGIFESFAGHVHGTSDETANVDFVLLNQAQYEDFTAQRPSEALMSVEGSHNQAVNYDLPPSLDQPVKYYIVFRSASGNTKKVVVADFHVEF